VTKTPRGIKAERPYSYAALEDVGRRFRRQVGLSVHQRIDALGLFDRIQDYPLRVDGQRYRIGCRVGPLDAGLEAQAQFLPDRQEYEVVLTEETYGRLETGNPRGTWSLLHEVDHILLHPNLLQHLAGLSPISRAALYRGDPKAHRFCEDTEWQADALTGAIIMPADGIRRIEAQSRSNDLLLVPKIAQAFGASLEAASNRLETYRRHRMKLLPSDSEK
jgi:hypothetical protein